MTEIPTLAEIRQEDNEYFVAKRHGKLLYHVSEEYVKAASFFDAIPVRMGSRIEHEIKRFICICFEAPANRESIRTQLAAERFLPATHIELRLYIESLPDLDLRNPLIALGSETRVQGVRASAIARARRSAKWLDLAITGSSGLMGGKNTRFLALRP